MELESWYLDLPSDHRSALLLEELTPTFQTLIKCESFQGKVSNLLNLISFACLSCLSKYFSFAFTKNHNDCWLLDDRIIELFYVRYKKLYSEKYPNILRLLSMFYPLLGCDCLCFRTFQCTLESQLDPGSWACSESLWEGRDHEGTAILIAHSFILISWAWKINIHLHHILHQCNKYDNIWHCDTFIWTRSQNCVVKLFHPEVFFFTDSQ